ncbi:interleukin-1 receptor-associated kinase 1-binding protein 1 homolog [Anguilla rostrata]|uniref:interleukin-1 receptor-associated kinase 1-binding protein 1 homolog n=1 Tax=Anguilla rostrata TaxID=7938 RepID=UPI0030D0F6B8
MAGSPSRVFAALIPAGDDTFRDENRTGLIKTIQTPTCGPQTSGREVQVTGSCELSGPPDRATLRVSVSSSKDSVNDVTNSVSRRLEYILQALRQHEVKGENTTVTKVLRRGDNAYDMEAEVSVVFADFSTMQSVSNVLVEKLDKSVVVSPPTFSHSADSLNKLRRQACLAAVENARRKAREVCGLLGQALGRPLLVKEEDAREWTGQAEEGGAAGGALASLQDSIRKATVFVSSHVYVSFEIRPKDRTRKKH